MDNNEGIEAIKRFNRFYLRMSGLFSLYTDESPYTATEALVLFEIKNKTKCTASYLTKYFMFDKGYMSRMMHRFEKAGLVKRIPSTVDRRIKYIELTDQGDIDLKDLATKASAETAQLIKTIDSADVDKLIQSMQTIETILREKAVDKD